MPAPFLERLQEILGPRFTSTTRAFLASRPTTFRVNRLKMEAAALRQELQGQGFHLETVPWYREAFILRRGTLRDLQETAAYREGRLYVQNLSSMLPVLMLDIQPGQKVLDLTAAPGSKTTQIAAEMQGQGEILANDNNRIRCYKLKANLEMQGCGNVEVKLGYGEAFGRRYPEHFDRVLLDAPCSAEGRFQASEPASYKFWKTHKVHQMARTQRKLLASAIEALRPGGVLVYSTCTFAPEENEGVLDAALERFGNQIRLTPVDFPLKNKMAALTSWEDKDFHADIARCALRILPNNEMEGFFVARLEKQ